MIDLTIANYNVLFETQKGQTIFRATETKPDGTATEINLVGDNLAYQMLTALSGVNSMIDASVSFLDVINRNPETTQQVQDFLPRDQDGDIQTLENLALVAIRSRGSHSTNTACDNQSLSLLSDHYEFSFIYGNGDIDDKYHVSLNLGARTAKATRYGEEWRQLDTEPECELWLAMLTNLIVQQKALDKLSKEVDQAKLDIQSKAESATSLVMD